jgi:hypothetical protein
MYRIKATPNHDRNVKENYKNRDDFRVSGPIVINTSLDSLPVLWKINKIIDNAGPLRLPYVLDILSRTLNWTLYTVLAFV